MVLRAIHYSSYFPLTTQRTCRMFHAWDIKLSSNAGNRSLYQRLGATSPRVGRKSVEKWLLLSTQGELHERDKDSDSDRSSSCGADDQCDWHCERRLGSSEWRLGE